MLTREDLHIAGKLTLRKTTPDGQVVEEISAHNDITLAGRSLVARLFNRDSANVAISRVSKIQVGRSQAKFEAKQTALGDRVGETPISRIEASEVLDTDGRQRVMLRLIGELGENDCNDTLREAGLFTDDNVMYNRVTFDTVTKSKQFKLTLVWEILF
ncbi:MAG: hypothetical protein DPW09_18240 [Anaerolineae bacterium]|nr:hypothetical protein [Anaerolineales bacterium]MCQ3975387.1 hypothetical protein [Anaerolineae bacterium]